MGVASSTSFQPAPQATRHPESAPPAASRVSLFQEQVLPQAVHGILRANRQKISSEQMVLELVALWG